MSERMEKILFYIVVFVMGSFVAALISFFVSNVYCRVYKWYAGFNCSIYADTYIYIPTLIVCIAVPIIILRKYIEAPAIEDASIRQEGYFEEDMTLVGTFKLIALFIISPIIFAFFPALSISGFLELTHLKNKSNDMDVNIFAISLFITAIPAVMIAKAVLFPGDREKAESEARREARRNAEEEARRKAEEEARRKAMEEARRKAEEEARRKAMEEARRKAEEEARRKAEEEAPRKAEELIRKVALSAGGRSLIAVADNATEAQAKNVLEMVVLQMMANLPAHASQIWLYEPRASFEFAEVKGLQSETHGAAGEQWFSVKDAMRALQGFEERLLRRSSHLASVKCKNIDEYNKNHRTRKNIHFIIIDNPSSIIKDGQYADTLRNLAERGPTFGIVPIFIFNLSAESAPHGKALLKAFEENPTTGFFFNFLTKTQGYGAGQPPYENSISDLLAVLRFSSEISESCKNRILTAREETAAKSKDQDFLNVRIGESKNKPVYFSLGNASRVYHALMSGTSGSGKTYLMQNLLLSLCETYAPDELQLILLDCGTVSFGPYRRVEHVLGVFDAPTDGIAIGRVFDYLENELYRRKDAFKACGQKYDETVDNLQTYQRLTSQNLPPVLLVIDEFGSMMSNNSRSVLAMGKEGHKIPVRDHAARVIDLLAREGRKVGLHVLLITQSFANVNRMPEDFKSNPYLAIALKAKTKLDSRAILNGENDAACYLERFQAVKNADAGQPDGNIIVDLDKITEEEIKRRQEDVQKKWPKKGQSPLEIFVESGDIPENVAEEKVAANVAEEKAAAPSWLR